MKALKLLGNFIYNLSFGSSLIDDNEARFSPWSIRAGSGWNDFRLKIVLLECSFNHV